MRAVGPDDRATLAALAEGHARAFADAEAPWLAEDLARYAADDTAAVLASAERCGLIVVQGAAGEAEILTLAVDPARRRRGTGRALIAASIAWARAHAMQRLVLEVAEDNAAARGPYAAAALGLPGRRPAHSKP